MGWDGMEEIERWEIMLMVVRGRWGHGKGRGVGDGEGAPLTTL